MTKKKTIERSKANKEDLGKGVAKVRSNQKIYSSKTKEQRDKGYLLRIDKNTQIYVKDGVSPEVARERFLKRMEQRMDFYKFD